jgi:hypothetical protein
MWCCGKTTRGSGNIPSSRKNTVRGRGEVNARAHRPPAHKLFGQHVIAFRCQVLPIGLMRQPVKLAVGQQNHLDAHRGRTGLNLGSLVRRHLASAVAAGLQDDDARAFGTALFNRANIPPVVSPLIPALMTRAFKLLARSSASSWAGYA